MKRLNVEYRTGEFRRLGRQFGVCLFEIQRFVIQPFLPCSGEGNRWKAEPQNIEQANFEGQEPCHPKRRLDSREF